jgi:formate dehydrogenase subunit gamma
MSDEILSLAERKRLREKKLKKHGLVNIVTHWFNVASWVILLTTGLAMLANPNLRIMPQGYIDFFINLFGGVGNLIQAHKVFGMIWVFVITYNVLLGFRRYFVPFARKRMLLTPDDFTWFKLYPRKLLGKKVELPPQDAYNAGQKVFGYVVFLGMIAIMITGLIMTFSYLIPNDLRWIVQWSRPIHFGAVGLIVAGLMVHVYMAAFFPEEKSAFFSMFNGDVDALYARLHHKKWYEEKLKEEREYEMKVRLEEIEAHEQARADVETPPAAA